MKMQTPDYLETVYDAFQTVNLERIKENRPRNVTRPSVICVLRDELHFLPEFLDHYRQGGVNSFFFIDNGSRDGTVEFLRDQPDVTLYQTRDRFDWRLKQGWINLAMVMQGIPEWFVYVDADEKIVFDGYPQRSFADLCAEMDHKGIRRVRGVLVDMYGEQPILASPKGKSPSAAEWTPYFDATGYIEARFTQLISRKGGPRKRVFGSVDSKFNPELTKYPIFKLRPGEVFANPHSHWPYADNFISPCFLGILHYKFTPQFSAKLARAVEEKTYWGGSHEYQCYALRLEENPGLSLYDPAYSRRYSSPADLIAADVIVPI